MSLSKYNKSKFIPAWLDDERFFWAQENKINPYSAFCSVCKKTFSLSNMGKQALTSHMGGRKHQSNLRSRNTSLGIGVFFTKANSKHQEKDLKVTEEQAKPNKLYESGAANNGAVSADIEVSKASMFSSSSQRGLKQYMEKDSVTRAEIIWSLHCIATHTSMSAGGQAIEAFRHMFDDSEIAQKIMLGRTKLTYTIVYGLAPYFRDIVQKELLVCDRFVVAFDESLNKIVQKEQMDLVLRYWSKEKEEVVSRYYGSAFLGHSCAVDLINAFKKELSGLNLKNILQVSMDGPNVNIKFLRDLKADLQEDPSDPVLLEIGSCGLHTLHNAFKGSINATKWSVVEFLRAIYNVFKNVPARRSDYTRYSKSTKFPKKFCPVRWLQNVAVSERAESILPNLKSYIKGVQRDKKEPTSPSYQAMVTGINDKLMGPKLAFFKTLALEVEPILATFQGDTPMAPFLYTDLTNMLTSVMRRFVKKEVLEKEYVMKIDIFKNENIVSASKVDLGYITRDAIRKVDDVTQKQILGFRQSCLYCLQVFCSKLLSNSPLKYKLTKAITFCDPTLIVSSKDKNILRIRATLEVFVQNNQLSGGEADKIERDFIDFCSKLEVIEKMKAYSRKNERLDHFWKNIIFTYDGSDELMSFLKKVFILSHGNASVERGFSVNKECTIENQSEESLIAQRLVWAGIQSAGGVDKIKITKSMIHATRNARSKYVEAQEQKKNENDVKKKAENERKRAAKFKKELEEKKRRLMEEAQKEAQLLDDQIRSLATT